MQRPIDYTRKNFNSYPTNLQDLEPAKLNAPVFELHKQMPTKQIFLFLKQAIENKEEVVIQTNPVANHLKYSEMAGVPTLTPNRRHILLQANGSDLTFIIDPASIRFIKYP